MKHLIRIILLLLVFTFFLTCNQIVLAVSFINDDLAGTWYGNRIVTGDRPNDEPQWGYATGFINNISQFSMLWTSPSYVNKLSQGTFQISGGGEISIENAPLTQGIMSEDKELIVYIDGTPSNKGNVLVILVRRKASQSFSVSDFAGIWYGHQLVSGDSIIDNPRWGYGIIEMNTRGTFLSTWTSPGKFNEESFGTIQVDTTGQITIKNRLLTHGVVNDAKDMIVFIDGTPQNQGNGLTVLLKRQQSQIFSVGDFQGQWCGYHVVSGDNPPDNPRWGYGNMSVNSQGQYILSWNNPSISGELTRGSLQISTTGETTINNDPLTHGVMNDDKNMLVFIDGSVNSSGNVLNIFQRCSVNLWALQGMLLLLR